MQPSEPQLSDIYSSASPADSNDSLSDRQNVCACLATRRGQLDRAADVAESVDHIDGSGYRLHDDLLNRWSSRANPALARCTAASLADKTQAPNTVADPDISPAAK